MRCGRWRQSDNATTKTRRHEGRTKKITTVNAEIAEHAQDGDHEDTKDAKTHEEDHHDQRSDR